MLKGKKIVLCVCGGIAAYKAADITSRLKKLGCDVYVVMTKSATEFISKLTLETLSQNPVYDEMFNRSTKYEVEHISVAKNKDLFVVVPATANVIGKIANGIADDALTTTVMATDSKVLIAPAMNTGMYKNPILQGNIKKLKDLGYKFIEPESGRLACGDTGEGKLASVDRIVDEIINEVAFEKDLLGKKVVVTAGPTKEYIDKVRFISNDSSGKMGYAVAKAAKLRGADVTLISGETHLEPFLGVNLIKVTSAVDMLNKVLTIGKGSDILIKAAAVSDFRLKSISNEKIKKGNFKTISLVENPDILKEFSKTEHKCIVVGFCMETGNLEAEAKRKLGEKNLNMIVANDLNTPGAGFKTDTNIVKIIGKNGEITDIPKKSKEEIAHIILDNVVALLN